MKKSCLFNLIFLLISTASSTFAQKTVLSTDVIELNGDTLKGFVIYENWNKSPVRISFSNLSSGESPKTIRPADIESFTVHLPNREETYYSMRSSLDTASIDLREINSNSEPEFNSPTTLFALKINEGLLTLLEHKDQKGKSHYFIQERNRAGVELIYKVYNDLENPSLRLYNRKYLSQLYDLFQGWPFMTREKLRNVTYDDRSLSKIIVAYNVWKEGKTERNQMVLKKEPLKVNMAFLLGMANTSLKTTSNEVYPSSTGISGGLSFSIDIPRMKDKWSFNNEFLYGAYKVDGSVKTVYDQDNYKIYNHIFSLKYLRVNTLVHFVAWKGLLSPYINAGISNSFAFQKSYDNSYYIKTTNTETRRESTPFEFRSYEQGLVTGIGAKFRKLSFETRYELSNGFSDYSALKTSVSHLSGMLSYSF